MKFGCVCNTKRGIKFSAEPTTEVADVQYRNGYRPTVRVIYSLKCVVKKQTGYNKMYIIPPLQVLRAQALLSVLAEVRFVWNFLGLVHCVILYVLNCLTLKDRTAFDPGKETTAAYAPKNKDDQNRKRARSTPHVSPCFDTSSLTLTEMAM